MRAAARRMRRVVKPRSSRASRVGQAVLLVMGALLVLSSWAVASPPGSSPDEDWHLASVWCPTPLEDSCVTRVQDDGVTAVELPTTIVVAAACTAFRPEASGACVAGLPETPTWTTRVDNGAFPGGFYRAMGVFIGPDVTTSVMAMRVANGALAVALIGAAAALLSAPNRRLLAYGGLVVLAPMAVFLIAFLNPSSWGVTGVTAVWIGLHGFATEQSARRRGGLLAIALIGAALAATSRGDTGAFAALVSLAAAVLHVERHRADWRTLLAPLLTGSIGVAGFLTGTHASAVTGGISGSGPGGRGLLLDNIVALPALLIDSVTGPLNWLDTPMPAITWVPVAVFATAVAFHGLRSMTWPKGLSLFGMVLAFCALPLLLLQVSGAPVGQEIQGRYLTPLIPVILMTALWNPVRGTVERLSRTQLVVAFVAIVTAHAMALHTQIRRFVTGLDVGGYNLNRDVEWWVGPLSPMTTWFLGALGFAILAAALFVVSRPTAQAPQDGDDGVAQPAPASSEHRAGFGVQEGRTHGAETLPQQAG